MTALLPGNARRPAFHYSLDFRQRRHRRITRRRHRQRTMGRPTLDRPLWSTFRQKPVDQSRSKRITTTNPIKYLEILAHWRLVEFAIDVTNSAPIVYRRGLRVAQCRRHHLEVWKLSHRALDHAFEVRNIEF